MPPAPGLRKCTAYLRPGAGGMPLALRLSEGLGGGVLSSPKREACEPPDSSGSAREVFFALRLGPGACEF
jgi:hypothetical protein